MVARLDEADVAVGQVGLHLQRVLVGDNPHQVLLGCHDSAEGGA